MQSFILCKDVGMLISTAQILVQSVFDLILQKNYKILKIFLKNYCKMV